jgi:ubiquinone/menaquinone biosynthesis C-methylase UbiE
VLTEALVGAGARLLDIGCGPGLAAHIAHDRGASVAGIDAAEDSIAIAHLRTPEGDFRVGDMQKLPWPDGVFDVATSFNGFQFADDPLRALNEARRILTTGGRLAVVVWGDRHECDIYAVADAISALVRSAAPDREDPLAPKHVGTLLEHARFLIRSQATIRVGMDLANLASAQRAMLSAGPFLAVAQQVGEQLVRVAIADSLAAYRKPGGAYRLHNTFHFVIAEKSDEQP